MKVTKQSRLLFVLGALASVVTVTHAQDTFYQAALVKADIALKQSSTDDYLLAIARSAKMNVFADATNFPEAAPPLSGEWKSVDAVAAAGRWKGPVGSLIGDLANERKLSFRYKGSRTFLFWSEPDPIALAREIIDTENVKTSPAFKARYKDAGAFLKERDDVSFALIDYFKTAHNWDGINGAPPSEIPLSTLPADLRARVLAYTLRQTYATPLVPSAHEKVWFNEDVWKDARLQVRKPLPGNAEAELLIGSFMSAGSKKTPVLRGVYVIR